MHRRSLLTLALALLALLIAGPGQALAHGEGLQQTVDGYTVTLFLPEKGLFTGPNPLAVSLWDAQGTTPEATVSALVLAFTPAADGHGDTHNEAAPANDHATTDSHEAVAEDHAAADNHSDAAAPDDHVATDDHAAIASEHAHDGARSIEGRGLVVAPVALAASDELGEYRGELSFDQVGTYTVSVIFTVDGEERGASFDVAVAQSRPRGLVLGGFALVNGLAIGTAALLKWRGPRKPPRKPTSPVAVSTTTPEEQP
jgi:hypothetical protein